MKHTVKEWLVATRFWSFSVSAMPVIVTVTFLMWKGYDIRWLCAVLALVGNVMFHAAGNVLSDWWDYRKGVDNEKAYAIPQLVFGQFTPREYLTFSSILFAVAICIGLVLTCLTGWELLIIGGIGALLAAYVSRVTESQDEFKANISLVFAAEGTFRIILYLCIGVITIANIKKALLLMPAMLIGLFTGMKISHKVNDRTVKTIVMVLLILSGAMLVIKNI